MVKYRQRYSEEFKQQTLRFIAEQKKSLSEWAKDLNIPKSTLYQWLSRYQDSRPAVENDSVKELEAEREELRRKLQWTEDKLANAEEELAIIKKATHIFSHPKN